MCLVNGTSIVVIGLLLLIIMISMMLLELTFTFVACSLLGDYGTDLADILNVVVAAKF